MAWTTLIILVTTREGWKYACKNIMNFGQFLDKFDPDVQQLIYRQGKKLKRRT